MSMDAKLIVAEGPDKGLEFTLSGKREWSIGQDSSACDFVLRDEKVSPKHALIQKVGDRYEISSLDGAPLQINNQAPQTEKTTLQFEDRIQMGSTTLHFKEPKEGIQARSSEYDNFFDDTEDFSEDFVPDAAPAGSPPPPEQPPKEEPPAKEPPKEEEKQPEKNQEEAKHEEPSEKEPQKEESEDSQYDTIFEDLGDQETFHDLSDPYGGSERFILKVLSGPNAGAEYALSEGKSYILGTDVTGADIIFNDLSVSRHHARLSITGEPEVLVEDLNSRNGVIVDGEQIQGQRTLTSTNMVTLGTTTFVVLDRERAEDTFVPEKPTREMDSESVQEEVKKEEKKEPVRRRVRESTFIISGILFALVLVFGIGAVMLFKSSPVERPKVDYTKEIQLALNNQYPDIKYTYNSNGGSLFLVGHVLTTVDKEELLYNLNNLDFITQIDDNVVVDDAVAGEMNLVLSRYPIWRSVSINAPQPGRFVMSGYLPTRDEGAELEDFVNVQFPYVDRLTNYVVIEEDLNQDIVSKLHNNGFYSVQVELANGEVSLAGYVNAAYDQSFQKTIREISRIVGVRNVNNYVVVVGTVSNCGGPSPVLPYSSQGSPGAIGQPGEPAKSAEAVEEQFGSWLQDSSVVNLTDCQADSMDITHMYSIEGYADQGSIGRAVVIKGRILTVGDNLNGMRVLAIFENYVFLEKNGLKYKIEFNR